jgi:serine/threonine-protein kinase
MSSDPAASMHPQNELGGSLLGQCVGNYQIVQYIGAGAMGSVYLARHTRIGQEVAFKILHRHLAHNAKLVQRFEDEARAVARVGHRNIVQIYDFGELPDGREYFVMERLLGRNLGKVIETGAPLEPQFAAAIAREVALALGAAHKALIVHRDLKPDNVFVMEEHDTKPVIKVLDFGIAKLQGEHTSKGLTETGMVYGTPQYIAPEQAEGVEDIDGRADLYALGVVMFQMLTGRLPFVGGPGELLAAHVFTPPPDPRSYKADLPEELSALVLRLLAKSRDQRYASAEAMLAALDAIEILPARERTDPSLAPVARRAVAAPAPVRARAPAPAPEPEPEELVALPTVIMDPSGRPRATSRPPPPGSLIDEAATPARAVERLRDTVVDATILVDPRPRRPVWLFAAAAGAIVAILTGGALLALSAGDGDDRTTRPAKDTGEDEDPPAEARTAKSRPPVLADEEHHDAKDERPTAPPRPATAAEEASAAPVTAAKSSPRATTAEPPESAAPPTPPPPTPATAAPRPATAAARPHITAKPAATARPVATAKPGAKKPGTPAPATAGKRDAVLRPGF